MALLDSMSVLSDNLEEAACLAMQFARDRARRRRIIGSMYVNERTPLDYGPDGEKRCVACWTWDIPGSFRAKAKWSVLNRLLYPSGWSVFHKKKK